MHFDWLKAIVGDTYTDDMDKKVAEQIGKDFVSRTDFNTANEAKKTAEGLVKDRDKQLETLKAASGDAEALKAEIAKQQAANAEAQKKYEADLKQIKLDSIVETRLIKEGAVNTKAVKALLDHSKISLDGENVLGLDEQLKTLKTSEKWAFGAPAAPPSNPANPPLPGGKIDELKAQYNEAEKRRDFTAMNAIMAQIKTTQ